MSELRPGTKTALVIVDVQVGVMAKAWEGSRVIENIKHAVTRARELGIPVIWVQHESENLPRDSAVWQLVPELVPIADEGHVYKRFESSFEETDLENQLSRLEASHVVLAGAQTNWCIRATAYATLDRGYDLTLLKDAHTTDDTDLGDGTLIKASDLVTDLNISMTWLTYPGRKTRTATAAEVQFTSPRLD